MWRLLLTEIKYNRALLGLLLCVFAPYLVVFALFGAGEIEKSQAGVLVFMWSLGVIFSVFYMMDLAKMRRVRLQAMIPLSPFEVSNVRIFIFLGFWAVLSAGFWGVHLIFHSSLFEWETLYGYISLSGIMLFIHAGYLLALDVKYWLVSKCVFRLSLGDLLRGIIPAFLLGAFVLAFFSQGSFRIIIGSEGSRFFSSLPGGLVFLVLGLAAAAFDVAAYSRRRFYKE